MPQNISMIRLHPVITVTLILLTSLILVGLPSWQKRHSQQTPDFQLYPAGEPRKEAFFDYLGPMIDAANERWLNDRQTLSGMKTISPEKDDVRWVDELSHFFDLPIHVSWSEQIDALLLHVDAVPRSLALAQAAKESAWGTSRFAVEGHNYFGQRCYSKGCGLVPDARPIGARFEVRRFSSPLASVESYMNNINSHPDYAGLRKYRAAARLAGESVSGILAAEELSQYSERRQIYVDEIQSLIHFNGLEAGGNK